MKWTPGCRPFANGGFHMEIMTCPGDEVLRAFLQLSSSVTFLPERSALCYVTFFTSRCNMVCASLALTC